MRIGELAHAAAVNVETIRYYQRRALLEEPRRPGTGFRRYDQSHLHTLRFIRQALALGFTLEEARELLALRANGAADAGEVKARAQAKLAEIESKLQLLTEMKAELSRLVATCPGRGSLDCCPIIGSLESGGDD